MTEILSDSTNNHFTFYSFPPIFTCFMMVSNHEETYKMHVRKDDTCYKEGLLIPANHHVYKKHEKWDMYKCT